MEWTVQAVELKQERYQAGAVTGYILTLSRNDEREDRDTVNYRASITIPVDHGFPNVGETIVLDISWDEGQER